jgi:hypothetical protein
MKKNCLTVALHFIFVILANPLKEKEEFVNKMH